MIASYGIGSDKIELETHLYPITLDIDQAIPCTQIVSELLSNCLKHAFLGGKGKIEIRASEKNGRINLLVGDNGIGLPKSFDVRQSNSLGLQIVEALVRQLGGKYRAIASRNTNVRGEVGSPAVRRC
jgi:two-component sensor histidine kinase